MTPFRCLLYIRPGVYGFVKNNYNLCSSWTVFVRDRKFEYLCGAMDDTESINRQIEALSAAAGAVTGAAAADIFYRRGRLYWKLGQRGAAISDYERAVAIDSESPAAEALKMCRDIMDFYNTDLYNP